MKLSKQAKSRIKRMSAADRKATLKAAGILADCEVISSERYAAVYRTCNSNKMC